MNRSEFDKLGTPISLGTKTEWTVELPCGMMNPYLEIQIEAGIDCIKIGGRLIPWNELMVAKLRARGCEFSNEADGH